LNFRPWWSLLFGTHSRRTSLSIWHTYSPYSNDIPRNNLGKWQTHPGDSCLTHLPRSIWCSQRNVDNASLMMKGVRKLRSWDGESHHHSTCRKNDETEHVAAHWHGSLLNFSNALLGQNTFFFRPSNPRIILILKCRGVHLIRHLNAGLKQPKKIRFFSGFLEKGKRKEMLIKRFQSLKYAHSHPH